MVDEKSNRIKIIDFGLSRFFDPTACNPLSTMCGSPQYVAPEILELADKNRSVRLPLQNVYAIIVLCSLNALILTPLEERHPVGIFLCTAAGT